jgi:type I restriction-modification system DNA methylase subunit
LAGRDREKSASYYTPHVLTECLVKYTLKELLKGIETDEILNLTICEPAMGSAAFINEAIDQLSEAYLSRKQRETGIIISQDEYITEKQRVKMHIADHNVYGVDLNPIAVELAEVSLWLNTIHKGAHVPWFGLQLKCGNSLIGARRQFFYRSQVLETSKRSYLKEIPKRFDWQGRAAANRIYHFLLPDKEMASFKNKVIKEAISLNQKRSREPKLGERHLHRS